MDPLTGVRISPGLPIKSKLLSIFGDIFREKPKVLTKKLQEEAELAAIVCSGAECPLVYTKHAIEWNLSDAAKMPVHEAIKVRNYMR